MKGNLIDKFVLDHKKNFINHLYFMLPEIQELDPQLKKPGKKIQVINIYDN